MNNLRTKRKLEFETLCPNCECTIIMRSLSLKPLQEENQALQVELKKFADIDIDFIAKDEPFRHMILNARAVLEKYK